MACVKSGKYVIRTPSDPLSPSGEVKLSSKHYNIKQGDANLRILKLTSVFNYLPRVGPKQSGYFLVNTFLKMSS